MTEETTDSHQRQRRRTRLAITALLMTVIIACLLARLHLLRVRIYDLDEFEHLHAAYCITLGLVPYRDFFEHHGPLTPYLSAIVIKSLGATPRILVANRALSYLFVILTLVGT